MCFLFPPGKGGKSLDSTRKHWLSCHHGGYLTRRLKELCGDTARDMTKLIVLALIGWAHSTAYYQQGVGSFRWQL